jgi:alkanesulfonate monooxygenase SsuD/methylene tetrahydromethanopterin reductase-like flavin-dependent oxidoreductase (luciferase family)
MAEIRKETTVISGSANDVADQLAELMDFVGGDGFAFANGFYPSQFWPVVHQVIPILRERGLTRTRYRHDTFRENLLDPEFNTRR